MLIRMLYVSTAVGPITTSVTGTILRSAQAWNNDHGITGVLCQGQGVYLQVLEGKRVEVNALYARIAEDKRTLRLLEDKVIVFAGTKFSRLHSQFSAHPKMNQQGGPRNLMGLIINKLN